MRYQKQILVPPMAISLMTGAVYARDIKGRKIELTYTDGQTESAKTGKRIADYGDDFFTVVSDVQSKRTKGEK